MREVVEAVAAAGRGSAEAVDRLVDALEVVDARRDQAAARAALRILGDSPRLVVKLDEHVRRTYPPRKFGKSRGGLLTVALDATHRDGHVRERAVARMVESPDPALMPFLVLRAADWVRPVRDRARAGLALLLADDPRKHLPAMLEMTLVGSARLRGGFAHGQALAALLTAPAAMRLELAAACGAAGRRFVLETGLSQGWWDRDMMLALATSEQDVRLRARAAETLCRDAVWGRRLPMLRRLAGHRRPEVRQVALIGLLRLGEVAEVAERLDDPAPTIRAIAREAARQSGIDAAGRYRSAVASAEPPLGAIAGLADVGGPEAAELLTDLLEHPVARVRAHALRALHRVDAVPVHRTVALLRDPSPAVVRDAAAALRRLDGVVPTELARELLSDPARPAVRQAGYRLLRGHGPVEHLRAALLLAVDPDPRLAERGVAEVTRLVRAARRTDPLGLPTPDPQATVEQRSELLHLADRAAAALGDRTTEMLRQWLRRY